MKKILTLFFVFFFTISYSQNFYLDKHYNINNRVSTGYNIIPESSGYSLCGIINDSLTTLNKICIMRLDTAGNIIKRKEYGLPNCEYYIGNAGGSGFLKSKNGGYFLAGGIRNIINNFNQAYIMKVDNNYDSLWMRIYYGDTLTNIFNHCIETSDNALVVVGSKDLPDLTVNVLLNKYDSNGNQIFEKTINITGGHNGDKWDFGYVINETPDKGFLLGCYTVNINIQGSGDPVVIKTDSLGNMKWIKNFGGNEKELSAVANVCKDSNYIVANVLSSYTGQYNDPWIGKLHVVKLRPDGSVIWEKFYEPSYTYLTAYNIVSLPNGDFIISGIKEQVYGNNAYMMSYLLKINSNGDSLWYRDIYYSGVLPIIPYINYLYKISTTPDGGIIGCGVSWNPAYITQGMWFIKTDSLGCLQPGCQYVGVEELQKIKVGELKINPNPATTQTTINYPTAEKAITLQIYNMLGQVVYEEKLNKGSSQTIIITAGFKPGLYKVVAGESSASLTVIN